MKIIISCGKKKRSIRCQAKDLYIGSYFTTMLKWVKSVDPTLRSLLIISAKHGLISPFKLIDPYDLRMGDPGSISVEKLRSQADELKIDKDEKIISLVGEDYFKKLSQVFINIKNPLKGISLGFKMQFLLKNLGKLP